MSGAIVSVEQVFLFSIPFLDSLPCFRGNSSAVNLLLNRFHIGCSDEELRGVVNLLIDQSRDSLTTRLYDWVQYQMNDIRY